MKSAPILIFLILWACLLKAQPYFHLQPNVQVSRDGKALVNPWVGGLNYLQLSSIDVDFDGVQDVFAFDRSGNRRLVFRNAGLTDSVRLVHLPGAEVTFPPCTSWAICADYNQDGKADLFTYNQGAMDVYRNVGSPSFGLSFIKVSTQMRSYYGSDYLPLYISGVDLPALADADGDGDLDVFTFSPDGVFIQYHRNLSKETYGVPDSLNQFHVESNCWGEIRENFANCQISLNLPCTGRPAPIADEQKNILHSGSSLMAYDANANGVTDLLVGDISCNTIAQLINEGTNLNSVVNNQDAQYPSGNVPVELSYFPAAFFLDVNNDSKRDLVVCPNAQNAENVKAQWYYRNAAQDNAPDFRFQRKDLLASEVLDAGENSLITIFDADADGRPDLLMSSFGYLQSGGTHQSRVTLLRNTTTNGNVSFAVVDSDYLSLSQLNMRSLAPSFGDLNGDNLSDIIMGNEDGKLIYIPNSGTASLPSFLLSNAVASFGGIDVGSNSVPQIVDWNSDGILDVLVGNRSGRVYAYQGTNSAQPLFTLSSSFWGGVSSAANLPGQLTLGYATPRLVRYQGSWRLFSGSTLGGMYAFDQIDGNLSGTFHRIDSAYLNLPMQPYSSLDFADFNGDQQLDMVAGGIGGGLMFFEGTSSDAVRESEFLPDLNVFPNPTNGKFSVTCSQPITGLRCCNALGQEVKRFSCSPSSRLSIDLGDLPGGWLLLMVETSSGIIHRTLWHQP
jgi:hypothetical protein